ncbi:MAG TPA: hypothetical protein VNN18_11595 [Candidatus Xenobia bacterium]|nr:hypothetical protein [Candidatus Xenobia bacterium]
MTTNKVSGIAGSVLLVVALALAGYWLLVHTQPDICRICQRPIHAQARAVVEENGRREAVCCARCAFRQHQQKRVSIRLLEVTDYVSGRPLAPEDAFYVEGSRVVLCARHEPLLDDTKHPQEPVFDRCVPSLYAFAREDEARAFAAENGGAVRRLPELLQETGIHP